MEIHPYAFEKLMEQRERKINADLLHAWWYEMGKKDLIVPFSKITNMIRRKPHAVGKSMPQPCCDCC